MSDDEKRQVIIDWLEARAVDYTNDANHADYDDRVRFERLSAMCYRWADEVRGVFDRENRRNVNYVLKRLATWKAKVAP